MELRLGIGTAMSRKLSEIKVLDNPSIQKERRCHTCREDFIYDSSVFSERDRLYCSLACMHKMQKLYEPSPDKSLLKRWVEGRDQNLCQLCGKEDSENIHYIDYDHDNLNLSNVITLCDKCLEKVSYNETFWEVVLSGLISGSKIIKKTWGMEIHIVNHEDYCLKYLVFFEGKQFSYHLHRVKKELWHCLLGKFEMVLEKDNAKTYSIFKQGDKIEIEPGRIHQLQALKDSILVEVSTTDDPEDSIRIVNGVN